MLLMACVPANASALSMMDYYNLFTSYGDACVREYTDLYGSLYDNDSLYDYGNLYADSWTGSRDYSGLGGWTGGGSLSTGSVCTFCHGSGHYETIEPTIMGGSHRLQRMCPLCYGRGSW